MFGLALPLDMCLTKEIDHIKPCTPGICPTKEIDDVKPCFALDTSRARTDDVNLVLPWLLLRTKEIDDV